MPRQPLLISDRMAAPEGEATQERWQPFAMPASNYLEFIPGRDKVRTRVNCCDLFLN